MLTRYLESAMRRAQFEQLEDGSWYGSIPGFEGVWANAVQLEACREELREVLEEWLLIGLSMGHPVPAMDGIDLRITEVA